MPHFSSHITEKFLTHIVKKKIQTADIESPHLFDILSLHHILVPHLHSWVEEALDEVS